MGARCSLVAKQPALPQVNETIARPIESRLDWRSVSVQNMHRPIIVERVIVCLVMMPASYGTYAIYATHDQWPPVDRLRFIGALVG